MKILLINPPYDIENYYGKLSKLAFVFPPVGLTYLAGYLRQEKHNILIYDFQVEKRSFESFLEEFKPDLVGITCQTALFYNTLNLAKKIKAIFPQVPIIVGGAHPTYRPNDFFASSDIDIVVRGEGELVLSELASYYEKKLLNIRDIKGISFKRKNKTIHNSNRELIRNLDILPIPAIDLLSLEKYRVSPDNYLGGMVGVVSTSRGCPFDCIFCACKEAFNRTYRGRNMDTVFEEINYYTKNYNISQLFVMDDCFGLKEDRVIEFCDRFIAEGYHRKIKWWCQLRVDCVNRKVLEKMHQAGCRIISFGIESGVQRILDGIAKRVTLKQIKNAVRMAKKVGLEPRGSFIIGLPTEKLSDSLRTIFFSLSIPLRRAKFGLATPYPGTKLWEIALSEGQVKDEGENWDRFSQMAAYTKYNPPYIPKGRKIGELIFLQKFANFIFYFKPGVILSFLRKIKNPRDLKYFLQSLGRFLKGTI